MPGIKKEPGHCLLRKLQLTGEEPVFKSLLDHTNLVFLDGRPHFTCAIKTRLLRETGIGLGRCSNPFLDLSECPWARIESLEAAYEAITEILNIYLQVVSRADLPQ